VNLAEPSETSPPDMLWAELAPGSHVVQFCNHDDSVLDTLETFAAGGLLLGEGVIVLATGPHLAELRRRLRLRGMDLAHLQIYGQLVLLDAEEVLQRVLHDGRVDTQLFLAFVAEALERARNGVERPVRAFGELVQLLWERGERLATLEVETIWQRICDTEGVALLCAYRKEAFAGEGSEGGIRAVCQAHGAVIA
jgi:hypothetical protein